MLTTVILVRHGQTDWNLARRWQGHIDIPLNETGRRQAQLLAQRLSDSPIVAIYTSDLARAKETADILAKPHGLKPYAIKALRERHAGQFEGLTAEELLTNHAQAWREVRHENKRPPGGESLIEVVERINPLFESIIRRHEGQHVIIVSHGGALNLLIAYILGLPVGQPAKISLRGNTGISIVEIEGNERRLVSVNDTHHLSSSSQPSLQQSISSPAETG